MLKRNPYYKGKRPHNADQIIYTARTVNDAAITLPDAVQKELLQAGLAHQSLELVRGVHHRRCKSLGLVTIDTMSAVRLSRM